MKSKPMLTISFTGIANFFGCDRYYRVLVICRP
jgi:hypothetical protein